MVSSSTLLLASGTVDLVRGVLQRADGEAVSLTTRECALLDRLARTPGVDVAREALLVEVWGHPADSLSRAVDHTMRRLRSKVELDSARPQHLLTVHGVGYRFVPLAPAEVGAAAATVGLVGRLQELAELRVAVEKARCVQVLGPGGVGKTRLVRAWMPPTARFVDLTEARTRGQVGAAVARTLGVGRRNVGAVLADTQPLLVLDNAEQVVGPLTEWLEPWLAVAEGPRFVLTSRVALAVSGARVRLGGLPVADGVALYRAVAGGADATDDVERLVVQLDGLPLAVELAAARAPLLGPGALLERLDRRFSALGRRTTGPARHRALDAAIEWSWSLLDGRLQDALARLAAFAGGFSVDAVEGVLGARGFDDVEALARASLVSLGAGGRGCLADSVRAFVRARAPEQVTAAGRQAHVDYFRSRAVAAGDGPSWAEREFDNLVAAARAAASRGGPALALVEALEPVLQARGPGEVWAELVRHVVDDGPRGTRLAARRQLALGDAPAAAALLAGVSDQARDDPRHHLLVARVNRARRDFDSADAAIDAGLCCAQAGAVVVAALVHQRALCHIDRGDWESARHQARAALRAWEALERPADAARAALHLGHVALETGDVDEAAGRYELARDRTHRVGDRRGHALATVHWALALVELGELDEAAEAVVRARQAFVQVGDRRFAAFSDLVSAECLLEQGAPRKARRMASRSRTALGDLGDRTFAAAASTRVLAACAQLGDHEGALRAADRARAGLHGPGAVDARLLVSGLVAAAGGDNSAARVVYDDVRPASHLPRRLRVHLGRVLAAATDRGAR